MPKLPFTKDDYKKMLDAKLGNKTPSIVDKIKQFGARIKAPKGIK